MNRNAIRLAAAIIPALVVLLVISGCGTPREVSTPRKALLGHWKNTVPGSKTRTYFSESSVTYTGQGSEYKIPYSVIKEDPGAFTLFIRLGQQTSTTTRTDEVTFSTDRKTMDLLPSGIPEKLQYTYVDSRQAP